jgi:hypothetical protein
MYTVHHDGFAQEVTLFDNKRLTQISEKGRYVPVSKSEPLLESDIWLAKVCIEVLSGPQLCFLGC